MLIQLKLLLLLLMLAQFFVSQEQYQKILSLIQPKTTSLSINAFSFRNFWEVHHVDLFWFCIHEQLHMADRYMGHESCCLFLGCVHHIQIYRNHFCPFCLMNNKPKYLILVLLLSHLHYPYLMCSMFHLSPLISSLLVNTLYTQIVV